LESGSGELNLRAVDLYQRAHKGRYGEIEVLKTISAISRRARNIARRPAPSERFEQTRDDETKRAAPFADDLEAQATRRCS
jgi:hypothetical protein